MRELTEGGAAVAQGGLEQVEGAGGGEGGEECAPGQRLRPVRRRLLHREEHAPDRRAKGSGDSRGGASGDEVAPVPIVGKRPSSVRRQRRVRRIPATGRWRQSPRRAPWPFLAADEARAIEQTSPPSLARSVESRSRGQLDALQARLDLWDAGAARDGLTNSTRHAHHNEADRDQHERKDGAQKTRSEGQPGQAILGVLQIFGGDVDSEGEQTRHGAEQHAQHPLQESMQPAVEAAMPAPPILPAVEIIARQGLERGSTRIFRVLPQPRFCVGGLAARRAGCARVHFSATRRTVHAGIRRGAHALATCVASSPPPHNSWRRRAESRADARAQLEHSKTF